jgi:hypothetical protein
VDESDRRSTDKLILKQQAEMHEELRIIRLVLLGEKGSGPSLVEKVDRLERRVVSLERIKYAMHIVWALLAGAFGWMQRHRG